MMLVHPHITEEIVFNENIINILVIENPPFFAEIISDIYNQTLRLPGRVVLSNDNTPIEIYKHMKLLTQIVPFDINERTLTSKFYSALKNIAVDEEYYYNTQEMIAKIKQYIFNLYDSFDYDLTIEDDIDISNLFKLFGLKFNEECLSISEKIIEHMLAVTEFEGEKIFVFVNLKSYIPEAELEALYKTAIHHKLKLLLIESTDRALLKHEKKLVIDNDLCEI